MCSSDLMNSGMASCMPEFMVNRLPIDVAIQEEGDVTLSEVLHRIELGQDLEGVRGVAYAAVMCQSRRTGHGTGTKRRDEGT